MDHVTQIQDFNDWSWRETCDDGEEVNADVDGEDIDIDDHGEAYRRR